MKRLFATLMLTAAATAVHADLGEVPSAPWLTVTKDLVFLVPSYTLNLTAHEMGHVLTARVFDDQASFTLRLGRIGLPEGLATYDDAKIPQWYRPVTAAAGTAANLGLAVLAHWSLGTGSIGYHFQPLFSEVFLSSHLDLVSNVANAFVLDLVQGFPDTETSTDFRTVVRGLSWDKSAFSKGVIYAGLFALISADLYFSRDALSRHASVLAGNPY